MFTSVRLSRGPVASTLSLPAASAELGGERTSATPGLGVARTGASDRAVPSLGVAGFAGVALGVAWLMLAL
eukprot:8377914-Pyramimonas_sp.AAC.1